MKKLSSKIIIIFLLATFLWGGVGASFYNHTPTTNIVYAQNDLEVPTGTGEGTVSQLEAQKDKDSKNAYAAAWKKMIEGITGKVGNDLIGVLGSPILKGWTLILYTTKITLSGFLYISAALLDSIMKLSIEQFKTISQYSGVEIGWQIIRNLINISFIFILLYISILTIIGSVGPKAKSTVASVVIAALLINFSLFFTKLFIDAGNYLAVALSNHVGGSAGMLSSLVIDGTGLTTVLWGLLLNWSLSEQTAVISLLIFQIVITSVVLWAFLSAAFLFLGRLVMLIGLMTLSPVGFLGESIPWLKDKATEWRSALIGQVMVAPVFLFFMVLVTTILKAKPDFDGLATEAMKSNYGGTGFVIGQFVFFTIIIAMLLEGVKMSKKLSGSVGSFAEKMVQSVIALTIAAVTGGAAMIAARGAGLAVSGTSSIARGNRLVARATAQRAAGRATAATDAYEQAGQRLIRQGSSQRRVAAALNLPGQVGRALSGQTLTRLTGLPDVTGVALKGLKESILKTTKKETSLDLDAAFKYREKMEKEYEKRYGEIANNVGGKKERDEYDLLDKISKNINAQAEARHKKEKAVEYANMEAMVNGPAKDAERARLLKELKNIVEPRVAKEMGVDLDSHKARKDELKVIIEEKTIQKNKYTDRVERGLGRGIFGNKKVAQKLRSEVTYDPKDKIEDQLAKIIKQLGAQQAPPANPPAPCWVAEILFGVDDFRTHSARLWAATQDTWFNKTYREHGQKWAKWLSQNSWAKPIVRPIWTNMSIKGSRLAKEISKGQKAVNNKFNYLLEKIK